VYIVQVNTFSESDTVLLIGQHRGLPHRGASTFALMGGENATTYGIRY